jgi:hypothetical protein
MWRREEKGCETSGYFPPHRWVTPFFTVRLEKGLIIHVAAYKALSLFRTSKPCFMLFSNSFISLCTLSFCNHFLVRLFLVIPITSPQKTFDISIVAEEKWVRLKLHLGIKISSPFFTLWVKYFRSGFLCRGSSCFYFQHKLEHELQRPQRNSIQLRVLHGGVDCRTR